MYHVGVGLSGHGLRGVLVEKLVNLGVGKTIPHLHIMYQQYQPWGLLSVGGIDLVLNAQL